MADLGAAQLMTRSKLACYHAVPSAFPDDRWRKIDRCRKCGGAVLAMRRGDDYTRQEEHAPTCGKKP